MKNKPELNIDNMLLMAGLRRTKPRTAILKVLLKAGRPITQEQIAVAMGTKAPDKVTIYRTLETFVSANIVHRAFLQARTQHFEMSNRCTQHQCHPHFTCTSCGDTHCMTEIKVPMTKSPQNGFIVRHQRVQLEGLCPHCAK